MIAPEVLPRVFAALPRVVAMSPSADPAAPAWLQFAPFALILGIFYFVILAPMRKRQKKVAEFQQALKVGDKVVTTSGLYGTVARVGDTSVQLKIAEKVNIEVTKASVAGYQGQDPVVPEQGAL
jgi:preprotein translocase subunit YajC